MARVSSWSNRGLQRTNRYGGVSLSGGGCSLACKCCCRVCFLSTSKDAADVLKFICGKIAQFTSLMCMDEAMCSFSVDCDDSEIRTGLTCSGLNSKNACYTAVPSWRAPSIRIDLPRSTAVRHALLLRSANDPTRRSKPKSNVAYNFLLFFDVETRKKFYNCTNKRSVYCSSRKGIEGLYIR
jgi:hypothetical protein